MYFFKVLPYVPCFETREHEAYLIKCHLNNNEWCYKVKKSYTEDKRIPANAQIYHLPDELEQLTLLTHSETIERNGLTILFVQKGTMELINPVEMNRCKPKSLEERIDTFLDKNIP